MPYGILALVTLTLMLLYSVKLTLIVLISIAVYTTYRLIQFRSFRTANHEHIAADAKLDSILLETIRCLQSIKLAGKEVDREMTWRNQFVRSINTKAKVGRLSIRQDAVETAATGLEYVLTIYIGALVVIQGGMTIGMLFAFLAYRSHFSQSMTNIVDLILEYLMVGLHLERISDITSTHKEIEAASSSRMRLPLDGNLSFKALSYRYSSHDPFVFKSVSGSIAKGEKVALFGPSGSGKTTFLKILMGLTDPSEGEITIDGISISTLGIESYRHQIGSVMQEDGLFSGTLLENITFFETIPNIDKLRDACLAADILEDIEKLPMSYDTVVSDMGSSLSVGQRQRVLIARAIYRQPKILFLDEGTAHVGKDSEAKIMGYLCQQHFTCVFATHNPKLLQLADKVLIWDLQGKVSIRRRRPPVDVVEKPSELVQIQSRRCNASERARQ
ncbi:MAG: ATP-binding cassette domain-containing protein [Pseudomonadota bacterium]